MSTHLFEATTKKPGSSPGLVEYVGQKRSEKVCIRLFCYDEKNLEELEFETIEDALSAVQKKRGTKWLNIDGLHDVALIKTMGAHFGIHPLALEDVVNTHQRPKIDPYEKHLFLVMKMFYLDGDNAAIVSEQMSFVLGHDYLLSFQERRGDVFEEVRKRLRTGGTGAIRKMGPDYLLYALTDAIVDHYYIVLEKISSSLEEADEELTENPSPHTLRKIHNLKKQIVFLKKMTWPLRELFGGLSRLESPLIHKKTHLFFRDVQDHTIQVLDSIESFREMISGMTDLYQSTIGNKMNEVMKVLTIIATLFIPPTFLAGVYGMNFDNMPELHTSFGYFIVIALMLLSISAMLLYFRKKKWL